MRLASQPVSRHGGRKDMGAGKFVNEGWGNEGVHTWSSQFYQLKAAGILDAC